MTPQYSNKLSWQTSAYFPCFSMSFWVVFSPSQIWKGFMARKKTKIMREEELIFVGMVTHCFWVLFQCLIGKKIVGKKIHWQKISSHFTDEFFTDKVVEYLSHVCISDFFFIEIETNQARNKKLKTWNLKLVNDKLYG